MFQISTVEKRLNQFIAENTRRLAIFSVKIAKIILILTLTNKCLKPFER